MVAEIEYAIENYGIKRFRIQDDNFTFDIERAKKICNLIIEKNLNIKFRCEDGVRADKITPELAKLLAKAGCEFVIIGIESGDEKVFKEVKKGETLDDIRNAVKLLKAEGIEVKGTVIIGLYGATFESDMNSLQFVKSLGIDSIWHHAFPFRGTELHQLVEVLDFEFTAFDMVSKTGKKYFSVFLNNSFNSYDIQLPKSEGQFPIAFQTTWYKKNERNKAFIIACMETGQYTRPMWGCERNLGKLINVVMVASRYNVKFIPAVLHQNLRYMLGSVLG